jgi:hypothetical protein
MNEDPAAEPAGLQDRPTASRDAITVIMALEGKFDAWLALTFHGPIIQLRLDGQESHRAVATAVQREMCRTQQVEIRVPQLHLRDLPRTDEGRSRGSTRRS